MLASVMRGLVQQGLSVIIACAALAHASLARGDTLTITRPGSHPRYNVEAEPHLVFGAFPAPGPADGSGYGVGARGTLELIDNGFISKINNTVGIGVGVDWVHYDNSNLPCEKAEGGNCADLNPDYSLSYVYVPVVLQWNFWLSRDWSVFGEPGIDIRFMSRGEDGVAFDPFVLFVGGRYHFTERITLTLRVGYPTFSAGASFLL
jgi:hypothetical protein